MQGYFQNLTFLNYTPEENDEGKFCSNLKQAEDVRRKKDQVDE